MIKFIRLLLTKNKGKFLVFSFMCLSITGFSQTDTTVKVTELIKLSLEDLVNMSVSSASKIGQKISEAPSTVSIVSQDEITKYQWQSLNDIAGKQAGFSMGQDRFNHVIESRGISDLLWSNRLLVLVDGVPFSSFQSTVTNEAFALNMAKSVEVVRGPGAALYGTQAITGVLQMNTLSYSDLKGNGTAEVKIGDYGYRNIDALVGAKGKYFNSILSFNNFSSDGNEYDSYDALLQRDANGNFIKKRTQDEQSSTHIYGKIEGKDKLEGFSLSYHFQTYDFQMGHGFLTIIPNAEATSNVTRNYVMAKYVTPKSTRKLIHEYVLKYDYEVTNMQMQIVPTGYTSKRPDGTMDSTYYKYGFWEKYVTPVNSAFARSQWIYFFDNKATLMGGIEQDMVLYTGDQSHTSNVDLNHPGFVPFANGQMENIKPLYQTILDHPINNTGIYAQFTSGHLLGNKLTATLGLREDNYYYNYSILNSGKDTSRFLTHFSPRAVLVYSAKENLSFKAMYGNAFRVASPFEQFITNSIISGIATTNINPEQINTFELSCDWAITHKISWRNTLFYSVLSDEISTNSRRGAFDNTLGTTQDGFESELHLYMNDFSAFANYAFVNRIQETSIDPKTVPSNSLIWYPAHTVNAGISYRFKKIELTLQGHYQSAVERRSTEMGSPLSGPNVGIDYNALRGNDVPAWYTFDANINYHITSYLEVRLGSTNIFNQTYSLINNLGGTTPQPFDYQQAGRRIMGSVKVNF